MKTFHIKHIIGGLLFISSIALFSACSGSDDLIDTTADVSGLKIGLTIGDASVATSRADVASDANLHEDLISNINVFFFDADGNLVKQYYKDSNVGNQEKTLLASNSSWTTTFTGGLTYHVYVVANYGSSLNTINSLADLKNLNPLNDTSIYQPYPAKSDKLFVMDGESDWTVPTSGGEDITIPVNVKRAASKIVLNVTFSGTFKDNVALDGNWKWNLLNYGSKASVIDMSSPLADMGVQTSSAETEITSNGKDATTTVTTYAYQNVWKSNPVDKQTMIVVNIPCIYNGITYSTNKYYIPVTSLSQTDRNYIYTVNAKIDRLGDNNEPKITNLTYSVLPWLTDNININNSGASFLIVSPQTVILKNETDYNDIHYYSSDDVGVSIDSVYYFNSSHEKTLLTSTDDGYNKETAKLHTLDLKNGTIDFYSPVPTNFGPRYIVLKVAQKSGSKLSQLVTIKQYPLEYITSIQGSYSFKSVTDKFKSGDTPYLDYFNGIAKKYVKGTKNYGSHYYDGNMFFSKFFIPKIVGGKPNYDSGTIYEINDDTSKNWPKGDLTNKNNNHMYVVRITTTSSEYTIDKPLVDKNGLTVGTSENDNVVSPAFMIASQLGTVYNKSWSDAQEHCNKYVEVGVDGTIYDDWRLPTRAELQIICKYQKNAPSVMTTVLAGARYWGAYPYGVVYTTSPYDKDTSYDTAWIRCIRDMTINDLAKDN